jgi:hypothetical protein
MNCRRKFLNWLDEQDGHSVRADVVDEKFPNLDVKLGAITVSLDEDGNTLIPKRDYRDAIKYGQPLD